MNKLNSYHKSQIFGGSIMAGTAAARITIGISSFLWALLDISNIVIDHAYNRSKFRKINKNMNLYDYSNIESKHLILS